MKVSLKYLKELKSKQLFLIFYNSFCERIDNQLILKYY